MLVMNHHSVLTESVQNISTVAIHHNTSPSDIPVNLILAKGFAAKIPCLEIERQHHALSHRRYSGATLMLDTAIQVGHSVYAAASSEADKLYCYCQSPHDDVSEMIGCDAPGCKLEWFHFECVGIMVPPEGEWFCPDCAKKFKIK